MKKKYFFRLSFCLLYLSCCRFGIGNVLESLYRFESAEATSTNPGTSVSQFNAKQATQPGTGYWCSEGSHDPATVVSWIGTLGDPASLKGIRIRWAYSPKEVQIMGTTGTDSQNEQIVFDWHQTASTAQSFDEDIYFPKSGIFQRVKINMRGPTNNFYGITSVTPIASAAPLTMIVSGITSKTGDYCLQVSNGSVNAEGTPVVLDSCSFAIAAGDGRELWRLTPNGQVESSLSKPRKCLTLLSLNTVAGGDVVISDCKNGLESGDGRSTWDFNGNGQIVLGTTPKKYALSQLGTGYGYMNLVKEKGVIATSSSVADPSHGVEFGIDGNLQTYWASRGFADVKEHLVVFDIDLGTETIVNKVRVHWEYPPFDYAISISKDAKSWINVGGSKSNPSNSTMDGVGEQSAKFVRVSMNRPHPKYGKFKLKYLYGIRDLEILSNRLKTIVEDRVNAANSPDARDKYFLMPVREFDPVLSNKLLTAASELEERVRGIQESNAIMEEAIPKVEQCELTVEGYNATLGSIDDQLNKTKKSMGKVFSSNVSVRSTQLASGLMIGDTKALAAQDCYMIKAKNPKAPSAYYWLLPRCSPYPIRAWCNMETGSLYYFWNGNTLNKPNTIISSLVNSPYDVHLHCAEVGMEPFIPSSKREIDEIALALQSMGYDLNNKNTIPIAYDPHCFSTRCSGKYRDFVLGGDLTGIMLESATPEGAKGAFAGLNTAGIGLGGPSVSFYDIGSTPITSIVCSTNTKLSDSSNDAVEIDCSAMALENPIFNGLSDTNIVVSCPAGCEEQSSHPVYGGPILYHEASSICRAAIHSGILGNGGLVNVGIESGRDEYLGIFQNSIQSNSLADKGRSIRLGLIQKDCPIDLLTSTSFVQMRSSLISIAKHDGVPEENNRQQVSQEFNNLLESTYETIDEAHGIDPQLIAMIEDVTHQSIGKFRSILKPIETMISRFGIQAIETYSKVEDSAETLYQLTSDSYSELDDLTNQLDGLTLRRNEIHGYLSWEFDPFRDAINRAWAPFTSFSVVGAGSWSIVENSGITNTIQQAGTLSSLDGMHGEGTFLVLKHRRFYDMQFRTKIFASEKTSIGAAYKMRDWRNTYLIEITQEAKRLLKIVNGVVTVICEHKDGGMLPDTWYQLHIDTLHGRHRICMAVEGEPLEQVFNIQDETFLSGSIGLFSSGTSSDTAISMFREISVTVDKCSLQAISNSHPPSPPDCNHVEDTYFVDFHHFYSQQPATSNPVIEWGYEKNIDGRAKVIKVQQVVPQWRSPNGSAAAAPSIALIKGYKSCPNGMVTVDFIQSECIGQLGVIFRYQAMDDYLLLSLKPEGSELQRRRGLEIVSVPITVDNPLKFDPSLWNTVEVLFSGPIVKVRMLGSNSRVYQLPLDDETSSENKVGLAATPTCLKGYFDKLVAGPVETVRHRNLPSTNNDFIAKLTKPYDICLKSHTFMQRSNTCSTIFRNQPIMITNCRNGFCETCCESQTSILNKTDSYKCLVQCNKENHVELATRNAWSQTLATCMSHHPFCRFWDDSKGCHQDACKACCKTTLLEGFHNSTSSFRIESPEITMCQTLCKASGSS